MLFKRTSLSALHASGDAAASPDRFFRWRFRCFVFCGILISSIVVVTSASSSLATFDELPSFLRCLFKFNVVLLETLAVDASPLTFDDESLDVTAAEPLCLWPEAQAGLRGALGAEEAVRDSSRSVSRGV